MTAARLMLRIRHLYPFVEWCFMKSEQHRSSQSALNYIGYEDALDHILGDVTPLPPETAHISEAVGRVLAEEVRAEEDLPPFTNSAMDGFAVRAVDTVGASQEAPAALTIIGAVRAGQVPSQVVAPGTAIQIATGAPIPEGSDAVVQVERVRQESGRVLLLGPVAVGKNIRPAGGSMRRGQVLFAQGHIIRPSDIAVLAAVGRTQMQVTRRPRVAILATGDELVEVDQTPGPSQIRNSNEAAIAALVRHYGGVPVPLGIARDTRESLQEKIDAGLAESVDLFVTSAGVSMGEFDLVKDILASRGTMALWKVRVKPGKPLTFGQVQGIPWLGLPGNPVSTVVSCEVFVRPAILKMLGHTNLEKPTVTAIVDEPVTNSGRRHYMRGRVRRESDGYHVSIRGSDDAVQGSSLVSSLAWANGLVIIPETVENLPAGSQVTVHMLDWPESVF
jgi:molybdopterin molybdotransferase